VIHTDAHIVKARVWEWEGKGAWHFITIEKEQGQQIKNDWHWPRKGFGSIPVNVTLGSSIWRTSVFPEKGGAYLLPLKKDVREKEGVKLGDTITVEIIVKT
jgi:hypothetical protein